MTTSESHTVRYRVHFTGRVQGVFFRATAERISHDYDVTGWVRNEQDGSVLLVAEGAPPVLDAFIDAIKGAKGDTIEDVTVEQLEATGAFPDFCIRR